MKKYISFVLVGLFCALNLQASEPAIWSISSRGEWLKGDARGVSITDAGAITLAPKLSEVFKTEQPYVWSSAIDASGNVFLGTGSDGRIYRVDGNGKGAIFADTNELNVSALAIGAGGELFAGTSPDGKVYRLTANAAPEVFFEPKEKYIWSLAVLGDGSLAVGTGENGKIYRVRQANAKPETSLLFDTSETHIISLAADKQGNLYAGTDGSGLVLRFAATDGKPFALLDAPLREIHQIAVGSNDEIYALALSETTSTPKSAAALTAATTTENLTVPVEPIASVTPEPLPKSRYDLTAAKTVIYRITPGGSDIIWNSPTVVGFSIRANPNGDGVILGTSDKGRIFSITDDGRETLLLQSNEGQISTIQTRGNQMFATSSNQGKLYRFGTETVAEGTYESSVLNARTSAAWGRIWWRSNGSVILQTRSGNTEKPNETWSDWSADYADSKGAQVASPTARFLQWRAILKNSATLSEVSVAYLPRNIAPEILSIQVLPTNVGLIANPPIQIDPNIENSGLDPAVFGLPPVTGIPPRRVYQRAARALQWTAEDRNGDRLKYAVYYREVGETEFKLLRDELRENFLTIDGLALADGRYVFKITANDAPSNPSAQSLSGERTSEPVDVDNSAPTVAAVGSPQNTGDKTRVVFEASDSSSHLQKAEYSVNGGEWLEVYADDGISDGQRERYTLEIPLKNAGEYAVTLRVFDASGNAGNARVLTRK
ncbi:MAG: hypothetical protein AVDCRST_MAG74-3456 [uncultured Pyrinomonadaceae bacterium]|uniref:Fibronectin type-III domain-containing protein n=1 Tax=uncultured Pyrinomonadaceae bacterium TaxID=2283094 RepID=A0A6J4PWI7_9BACT|nr:MAG: hypothetical protein AVDCRST_MAG74-3456 [uncultured Pyrinomonadaceae bacterium]